LEVNILTLELSEQEREFLSEILTSAHTSLLDELHHTESYEYKQMLKQREELLETLRLKVGGMTSDEITV
jgi:hypothetical protein